MQRNGNGFIYSASDLNNFIECPHITELDKLVLAGRLQRPEREERVSIIAQYGERHERAYLDSIRRDGHEILTIERGWKIDGIRKAARETSDAMARGVPFIAQAAFFDGQWVGYADIVHRVETPSASWPWSYEAVDAKLARADKPYFILQLCNYSEQIGRLQGSPPVHMSLYLGTPELRSYRYADFEAFYRRTKERFLAAVAAETNTYPYPVAFCDLCAFANLCEERREADDHLSLVAFARRDQVERLAAGTPPIATMAALAVAEDSARPADVVGSSFDRLRRQAAVQVRSREGDAHPYELLPVEIERGLHRLPAPSTGDVFFDMEGDPFADRGLEYLFGYVTADEGAAAFAWLWADDAGQEKSAFEEFIDLLLERRKRFRDYHVYHYNVYEPAALKRLAVKHATRERELDGLLRAEIFCDLYLVLRQGMLVPGYSLKDVERFWAGERQGGVKTAMDSVLAFERWQHEHDETVKQEIIAYNRIDCESTLALRDWLLERRDEAMARFGDPPTLPEPEPRPSNPDTKELRDRQDRLAGDLIASIASDPSARTHQELAVSLLANLMHYHWREDKPVWWEYFDLCAQTPEQLVENARAIGDARLDLSRAPEPITKQSVLYRFAFPPQQHKATVNKVVRDGYGTTLGTIHELDDAAGVMSLKTTKRLEEYDGPPIRALIPFEIIDSKTIQRTLCDFAEAELATLDGAPPRFRAGRSILYRDPPRIAGRSPDAPLQTGDIEIEDIKRLCRDLDESYLFIQGPPGSGKTWAGARLVVDLLQRGRRIAIAANSHKAIDNILHEVEKVAAATTYRFTGIKKHSRGDDAFTSRLSDPCIVATSSAEPCFSPEFQLVAGTAWLMSKPELRERFDYLFIDEAGQVALANTLAMSTAAKNVVLLGDPLQLAQVSHGAQPEGAETSALEHLLGDEATIPPDRGVFLTRSYRMHPAICTFISDTIYEGRLESTPDCARNRLDAPGWEGAGLRFMPVDHGGEPTRSLEEASTVARIVKELLAGDVTTRKDSRRPMTGDDVLVVAPYNAQVRLIKEVLEKAGMPSVPVGTVDKFQGQEAPVVIYSMASPSAADVPHGLEFLFSENRLNVAISRAMCWSVIVASPRLLDANCRTVDQMRLVNSLCKFAEAARA